MNEVLKAMEERRSIRSFRPDMPDPETIRSIVRAGLYAPSGMNRQDTVILCVTSPEMRSRFAETNRQIGGWADGFDPFYGAPVIFAVLAKATDPTAVCDGSLVLSNLLLAAHATGLGGIWIHRAKETFEKPEFRALLKDLGIDGDWIGVGHCAVGYPSGPIPSAPVRKEGRFYEI